MAGYGRAGVDLKPIIDKQASVEIFKLLLKLLY